uniref:NADH-ubiquinone oxidoreductase chain 4L n=2 Tax=Elodes minuta TaxID=877997 RepID=A0A7D7FDV8_9COLE|nr:NADH dehydrogenase subunit 4L [Elodes minuta]YP_010385122.1 NADH dehydrogenase subunit 4L [Elodes marginata]QMP96563.1 NADH dehydrogenase subunit 4L [Elodes minuta]UPL65132.1 NADH dehydrogenase subunit 4L [Elodes marginata]
MFMNLFMFMYFSGVYVYSSNRKHLLLMLLSLEFIVLSLYMIIFYFLSMYDFEYFFCLMFLIFSVCEGVLGLSLLVLMIRSHGNDFINSFMIL